MFDWMHCYLVNGAFQLDVSLMCESFPLRQCDWQEAMQGYTWPARISSKGASGSAVFAKMRDWEFRCAASEGLSCYRPLRMFVSELDLGQKRGRRTIDIGKAEAARQSFLALCQVLDALQAPSADLATLIAAVQAGPRRKQVSAKTPHGNALARATCSPQPASELLDSRAQA